MISWKHNHFCWLTLVVLASMVSTKADEPLRLRILSYNIHHAEGVDQKLDIQRIAQVIMSVAPDLVALQEVDQDARRTGVVDQPSELARLTRMNVAFGANIELQGGSYGNAVLSRFPILRNENLLLPNHKDGEQRGVLEVELSVPPLSEPLRLFATHLDHRADDTERKASAKFLNALVTRKNLGPVLLAGDLNDTPDSATIDLLRSKWTPVNEDPLATVPVDNPRIQIDFVLYRPADRWSVVQTKVVDDAVASDHRAILAVVDLSSE